MRANECALRNVGHVHQRDGGRQGLHQVVDSRSMPDGVPECQRDDVPHGARDVPMRGPRRQCQVYARNIHLRPDFGDVRAGHRHERLYVGRRVRRRIAQVHRHHVGNVQLDHEHLCGPRRRHHGLLRLSVLGVTLALAVASVAAADTPVADPDFTEGRRLLDAGDYVAACAKLKMTYEREHTAGKAFNLSVCEEKQGHIARSLGWMKSGLSLLAANDDRLPAAAERQGDLEKRVARITIRAAAVNPSMMIRFDGDSAVIGAILTDRSGLARRHREPRGARRWALRRHGGCRRELHDGRAAGSRDRRPEADRRADENGDGRAADRRDRAHGRRRRELRRIRRVRGARRENPREFRCGYRPGAPRRRLARPSAGDRGSRSPRTRHRGIGRRNRVCLATAPHGPASHGRADREHSRTDRCLVGIRGSY